MKTRTVSDIPTGDNQGRARRMMTRRDVPIYTRDAALQMVSTSTPFLLKASRFSKHVETIETSILPPDYAQQLVGILRLLWDLKYLNLELFHNVLHRTGFRQVKLLLNLIRIRAELDTGEPRRQVFDCGRSWHRSTFHITHV